MVRKDSNNVHGDIVDARSKGEKFNIMGKMRRNPVADIKKEFLENDLIRLDSLKNYVMACLRQVMVWKERYHHLAEGRWEGI